ncbi:MAG: GNAT family N-acetyltransferase [Oscillospiraceae bacterium]|nr:GNAT family N-acetyltransferase [Oscillospiraceae bacterium]
MEPTIRTWTIEDASALAAVINNKKVQDNLRDGYPFPCTEANAAHFIRTVLNANPNTMFAFAIVYEGKVVGSIGLTRQENIHCRTAELGYFLGQPYWGKGIATRAVKDACQYVFENTDILRIFADPFACNTASCRVLEKNGFQYEGTMRQNAVKNGKVLDMKLYALIKEKAGI